MDQGAFLKFPDNLIENGELLTVDGLTGYLPDISLPPYLFKVH